MFVENLQVKIHRENIIWNIKKRYMANFGSPSGDQDKTWAPHKTSNRCYNSFCNWLNQRSPLCHSPF